MIIMNFEEFKNKYQKAPVVEYPNQRIINTALVTVRVLAYNHIDFVSKCLDSILMQKTSFDYEVLIAEDDSNDGTREVCIKYAREYPDKVRLLLNDRKNNISINGKPTGIFNSTYSNFSIRSKYIAMCEADDYWTDPTSLEKRVQFLEKNNEFSMCYHNAIGLNENTHNKEPRMLVKLDKDTSVSSFDLINSHTPTSTIVYRNGIVEKFDEYMPQILCGDAILKGKLSLIGQAKYINSIRPVVYRYHDGGIWSSMKIMDQVNHSLKVRKYLITKVFRGTKSEQESIRNISYNYFSIFISHLVREKSFQLGFLKSSYKYAKSGNTTLLAIGKSWFLSKLNFDYICSKI